MEINLLSASVALQICCANQLSGFYMRATLALNGLSAIRSWRLSASEKDKIYDEPLFMVFL